VAVSAPPPDDPEATGDPAASVRSRRPRATWFATLADRVPTGWFATIFTVLFLGVTAAFGGLAAVALPPVPELAAGETHESDLFTLTVERAVLIDALPEAGITVGGGERVLALVVTVENAWDRAVPSSGNAGVDAAIRITELGDRAAASVARFDDTTTAPYLQPAVPAQLVLTWAVPAGRFAADDELHVELRDFTLQTGKLITYGQWWDTPVTAAHLTVGLRDVGAGANSTEESGG
jgi:hypothetical protein